MDMAYWTGTSTSTLASLIGNNGTAGGALPGGATYDDCGGVGQPACIAAGMQDPLIGNNVKYLLVSAASNNPDTQYDFFKVQNISGTIHAATPEPATFGMVGIALVGFGVFRRKRQL
jgi:hypothetical protein